MFKRNGYFSLLVAALGMLCLSPSLFAQTMTVSEESAATGASEVVVDWNYTGGGGVEGFSIDITFDDALLTPQTTGTDVDGCLSGTDADLESCEQTAANTVRITMTNLGGPELPDQNGTITFDIAGGAAAGDTSALALSIASTTPAESPITLNDGSVEIVDVSAVLNVQPATHDFGGVESGTSSSPLEVTISNDGSDGIDTEVSDVSLDDTTNFSLDMSGGSNPCGPTTFTLADGQSCTVGVTFTPQSEAVLSAALSVTSDAGQVTNDTVALEGEGTPGPAGSLSISPNPHDFGALLTGDESETQVFTVTSDGDAGSSVDIDTANLTGDTAEFSIVGEDCTGTSLAEGSSCSVEVEFAPTSDGVWSVQLEVSGTDDNGDTRADTAAIDGEGTSEPRFSSSPGAGTVNLGQATPGGSLNQDVQITNEGNAPMDVSCGTLNDPEGVFTLTPSPADFTGIAGGDSETFNVACDVPDVSSYQATLQCTTNEGAEGEVYDYTFNCTGRPLVIPTMQPWGLVVLTMLMLMVGGLSIRYFRV